MIAAALAVVVLILIVWGVAAMQPEDYRLSRSITVAAAPAVVCAQIEDFHMWEHWSPWAKLDPQMQTTFSGAAAGKGAVYTWSGKGKVGAGQMTMLDSRPHLITIALDFTRPMKSHSQCEFSFTPQGDGTLVTWAMSGKKNMMAKIFHMVVSMEKILGPDFEKGLAQLKAAAEAPRKSA